MISLYQERYLIFLERLREMKKVYFVRTNGYDMLVSDDGEIRRVLTDNNDEQLYKFEDYVAYLQQIEDDSSWEEFENSISDFIDDNEVLAAVYLDI